MGSIAGQGRVSINLSAVLVWLNPSTSDTSSNFQLGKSPNSKNAQTLHLYLTLGFRSKHVSARAQGVNTQEQPKWQEHCPHQLHSKGQLDNPASGSGSDSGCIGSGSSTMSAHGWRLLAKMLARMLVMSARVHATFIQQCSGTRPKWRIVGPLNSGSKLQTQAGIPAKGCPDCLKRKCKWLYNGGTANEHADRQG